MSTSHFIVRAKRKALFRRISSNPADREQGVQADQTVVLQTKDSHAA